MSQHVQARVFSCFIQQQQQWSASKARKRFKQPARRSNPIQAGLVGVAQASSGCIIISRSIIFLAMSLCRYVCRSLACCSCEVHSDLRLGKMSEREREKHSK